MQTNLAQQVIEHNEDFLIGDVVVFEGIPLDFDALYHVTEVYENTVDVFIGMGILTINKRFVRSASTTELMTKRHLTEAEHSIAEVP